MLVFFHALEFRKNVVICIQCINKPLRLIVHLKLNMNSMQKKKLLLVILSIEYGNLNNEKRSSIKLVRARYIY